VYQSRGQDVEELLDIWYGLQQSAVDTSAIDGKRFFQRRTFELGNMQIE